MTCAKYPKMCQQERIIIGQERLTIDVLDPGAKYSNILCQISGYMPNIWIHCLLNIQIYMEYGVPYVKKVMM